MKKASKILSAFLGLVMVFALAVPAFADGPQMKSMTLEESGCNYTVAPIGKAYYVEDGIESFAADVFDQAVTFTMPEGGWNWKFTYVEEFRDLGSYCGELPVNEDGSITLPADTTPRMYLLHVSRSIAEDGKTYSEIDDDLMWTEEYNDFAVWTKAFIDEKLASEYAEYYKFVPAGSTTPAKPDQPSTPSQPVGPGTPSTPAIVKPAPGTSVMIAGGEFAYTVKSGDSLIKIAAYYYGNADVYKLIYERNKGTMKNADAVYAGQTIILPSYAAVAQGMASTAPAQPAAPGTPSASKPAPGVSVMIEGGEFLYTVKSGDSLRGLAAYYYGNAEAYKLIYERNKDTVKNADTLYAGQTIILPSYAAVAAGVAKL